MWLKSKSFLLLIGYLLTLLSIIYIVLTMLKLSMDWEQLKQAFGDIGKSILIVAVLIYTITLFIGSCVWSHCVLLLSGVKTFDRKLVNIYLLSNIHKYIPGNIFQFIGRNVMAKRLGYSHKYVAQSSLIEVVLVFIAGALLVIFSACFFSFEDMVSEQVEEKIVVIGFGLMLLIIVGTILIFYKSEMILNVFSYKKPLFLFLAGYLLTFIMLGYVHALFVLKMTHMVFSISDYFIIVTCFSISWLLGFVVPGAPGGIGIREASFVALLSGHFDSSAILLATVLFRLIGIVIDLLVAVIINLKTLNE